MTKKLVTSSMLILTKLASWPAKAIYKSLGARLRKNMGKILPTAIRVLLWRVLDLQPVWRVYEYTLPRERS